MASSPDTEQELELDLYTFSPVLKLHLGRIIIITDKAIKLEKVLPPKEQWEEEESDPPSEESDKEVIITLAELEHSPNRWKVVSLS